MNAARKYVSVISLVHKAQWVILSLKNMHLNQRGICYTKTCYSVMLWKWLFLKGRWDYFSQSSSHHEEWILPPPTDRVCCRYTFKETFKYRSPCYSETCKLAAGRMSCDSFCVLMTAIWLLSLVFWEQHTVKWAWASAMTSDLLSWLKSMDRTVRLSHLMKWNTLSPKAWILWGCFRVMVLGTL